MVHAFVRRFYWVDARDVLADGLAKGGMDRTMLHSMSNGCRYKASHDALGHKKDEGHVGSAAIVFPKGSFPRRRSRSQAGHQVINDIQISISNHQTPSDSIHHHAASASAFHQASITQQSASATGKVPRRHARLRSVASVPVRCARACGCCAWGSRG